MTLEREEIQDFIKINQAQIESEELIVLFLDECYLLWGDVCGYVWGRTNQRIEVPIKNIKSRQTYYGALNYQTKEFTFKEYQAGNSENTIDFIKYLQTKYQGKRIAVIWDGATYHKSAEFKEFLSRENDNRLPEQWQISCIQIAPNAPAQNPVEDVCLVIRTLMSKPLLKRCSTCGSPLDGFPVKKGETRQDKAQDLMVGSPTKCTFRSARFHPLATR